MVLCMAEQLLLQAKQPPAGRVGTHVFLLQKMLIFYMVLRDRKRNVHRAFVKTITSEQNGKNMSAMQ